MQPSSYLVFPPSSMSSHLLCLFFLLFTSNTAISALGNESDHLALIKFKESISSDPFGVLSTWNSSTHFCNWQGVNCGSEHQRVTELTLDSYNLQGSILPYVGNLSFLRVLSLQRNNLHGHVPQTISRLFRLRALALYSNNLVGEFPIGVTNCSKLQALKLSYNHFSGQIPVEIGSLGNLKILTLHYNKFSKPIPLSMWNLSSLVVLSAAYNNLEGNIPDEIGHLKDLVNISLAVNKMSGKIPHSLYNLSSLSVLSLSINQLEGSLPSNMFSNLPNLSIIELDGNRFSGPIPTSITTVFGLQKVDFSINNFVGQVPNLGSLRNLSALFLGRNDLGGNSFTNECEFIKSLINCSKLQEFSFEYNNFVGHLPNFIGNLSTQLTILAFGGNQISGKVPEELGNLVNLIGLGMENNHLIEFIPTSFGNFQKLQHLYMNNNKFSGEVPAIIGNLSQLSQLDLSHNMLNGSIPSAIGNCKRLEYLDFSYNNLSGIIPSQVFEIPSLSILLNISHNSLSGSLPSEIGLLKSIGTLDVSENHLSNKIPEAIGECESLEYLYLQGNSFHGIIPPSLASLKGLQHLDLSRNQLSGTIPQELQNITVLVYFNASFNMLEGEVPMNGVFRNTTEVSLSGNRKLCGGIASLRLPPCPSKATKKRKHHGFKIWMIVIIPSSVVFLLLLSSILALVSRRRRQRKASVDSTNEKVPRVSYQNLYNATNGFSTENLIGSGGYGSVYKAILDSAEKVVAVKVLNLQVKGAHKSFTAECNALRNIRHRNLVKIVTCCSSVDYKGNDFKALVYEYMSNGSLDKWLHANGESSNQLRMLNLQQRLEVIRGVASAMHYLHYECEQPVIHCDLKPSNVLLGDNMDAQVSDFGLARLISAVDGNSQNQTSTSGIKGTIGYAPPEYGTSSQVSIEGDIYSFGILVLEMLTEKKPTEEMFKDGCSLHNYVHDAFPNNMLKIVDATLLSMIGEEIPTTAAAEENNHIENEGHLQSNVENCLFSLFKIGLACSVDSPRERMTVMEVNRELNIIKNAFHA
ncbi:probable LRR receptor-like serine/threonine-protein kinase At3g47570 [Arachis ipaensis]|uniref:probable LRR receptor-like serine/threonine-protein kinase At3g47570 n=1 Tax=Arachis ipaensis TaxID=130454 RepID=UPI0007AFAA49|nr:probable LRR receptor-like serine/threonine-protein kinase At3g47570 [Arachis ipaensis]